MPRINLLPVRAMARIEQAKQELVVAGAVNLALVGLLAVAYQLGARELAARELQRAAAERALATLATRVAETEQLKVKSAALATKLAAIDKLRGEKEAPAPLLAFFADTLGDLPRVWLTRLAQQEATLTLEGGAMSQGDISAFQLALADRRPAFRNVELALVNTTHQGGADYLQWTITCLAPAPAQDAPAKAAP